MFLCSFFENFYWSIVDLQRCASFRCTTKWISYTNTYAATAAKSLQSCLTLFDPTDGSPPGSPSPGFSRQEHWRGLPFPSPMHESEKWKWSRSVVYDSSRPHGLQPTRLLCPWDFPGKSTGVGCHWSSEDLEPHLPPSVKGRSGIPAQKYECQLHLG